MRITRRMIELKEFSEKKKCTELIVYRFNKRARGECKTSEYRIAQECLHICV